MVSRRERREQAADAELGRRHPYYYGGAAALLPMIAVVATVAGGLVLWFVDPGLVLTVLRWAAFALGVAVTGWLFWYVGLRRR